MPIHTLRVTIKVNTESRTTKMVKKVLPGGASAKLDEMGLDAVCDEISSGGSICGIARRLVMSAGSVLRWIDADPARTAAVHTARVQSGIIWDEIAEEKITAAADPFELAKARDLAHHYRWRAKCVAPRFYGDRNTQELVGAGGGAISIAAMDFKGLTDLELAQMHEIALKAVKAGR